MDQGYYRLIDHSEEFTNSTGDIFYLISDDEDGVRLLQGERAWIFDYDRFITAFESCPNGAALRAEEMAALMSDLHTIGVENDQLLDQQSQLALPFVGVDSSNSTDISLPISNAIKENLKTIKISFAKTQLSIEKRQQALRALIEEQQEIIKAKMELLKKQVSIANEAMDIISVYLGTNEEIVRIKKGPAADKNEKVVIRQQILFMDEECAISAETGGIDVEDITIFDKWVIQPDHLQQVIPEPKCVVALKVRRTDKRYNTDYITQSARNQENKQLYVLIRNGESVYRIYTTIEMDTVLFPTKREFEEFFNERKYDYKTQTYETVPLEPGTRKYAEAMEKSDSAQRKYYKAMILLQGLFDRTPVFKPMPSDHRINICNLDQAEEYLQMRYDGENVLGDGRPAYEDWLAAANAKLEVGHRIIGYFDSYSSSHVYDRKDRVFPSGAVLPKPLILHTIEDKLEKGFMIRYERTGDAIYRGWQMTTPKRRASFQVFSRDSFILNFDAVTVEEMEYYLSSRLHRHEYLNMLPLLKTAIELKKKEIADEEPFRLLLIGEIAKVNNVSLSEAEDAVDKLISWWKFKNFVHRSLDSEDSKAIRMIVAEFARRKELASEVLELQDVVDQLKVDETVAIWHSKKNEFVVFNYENDENIFLKKTTWKQTSTGLVVQSIKEWQVAETRHLSWNLLYQHPRWKEWNVDARLVNHLTDPERAAALEFALKKIGGSQPASRRNKKESESWGLPLYWNLQIDGSLCLFYAITHAVETELLTERLYYPDVGYIKITFEKNSKEVKFFVERSGISFSPSDPPWVENYRGALQEGKNRIKGLKSFDENIEMLMDEFRHIAKLHKQRENIRRPYRDFEQQLHKVELEKFYEAKRLEFLEEFNDEELWLAEKKKIREPHCWPSWLETPFDYIYQNNHVVQGKSVKEVIELARSFGYNPNKDRDDILNLDYVFKDPDPKNIYDEDENEFPGAN